MTWKKMTIVLMPDDTNELRHFRVPRVLVVLFIPLALLSLAFSIWVIQDYIVLKARVPRPAELPQESRLQEGHSVKLTGQIKQLAHKVRALTELDHKLKAMGGPEKIDAQANLPGMGGSPTSSNLPDLPPEHERQGPDSSPVYTPMVRQKIKRLPAALGRVKKETHPVKASAVPVAVKPRLLREKAGPGKKAYSVQVGAFLVQKNADRLTINLRQRGYNAFVKDLLDRLEQEWHTVRLRDFSDLEEAFRLAEAYRNREGKLAIVTPINSLTQIISKPTQTISLANSEQAGE